MTLPELLAPAGNMERFKAALHYGADAVYLGAETMSLRNYADNFTQTALAQACTLAHSMGKKVYVAMNAFARDKDFLGLEALMKTVRDAGADALIVNDPGVIRLARRAVPQMPLHLSTQANTLNTEAALFWMEHGVRRIILARELSILEITRMRDQLPKELELEMFVHGAMCISYSGRCLLSNYIAGRDANRGECAQPCRWTYELRERGTDGAYYGIEQDENGTFLLNSRDLRLIEYLPQLIAAGVTSLKIEGRMKSLAYVATVTNAYRMALDEYWRTGEGYRVPEAVLRELEYASHRPYTTGFALGDPGAEGQNTRSAAYVSDAAIAAVVEAYDPGTGRALVTQRNKFTDGEVLLILSPGDTSRRFLVSGIRTEDGTQRQSAPHPKERLWIGAAESLRPGDILRKMP